MLNENEINQILHLLFEMSIKLLVILLIIKLYARKKIFKSIKRKHGQDIICLVRSLEHLKTKYMKILADIKDVKAL